MNPSHDTAPAAGPGAQLAQARADLGMTHEEVAAKLHLASRQIQALEQDDYSSLPGATYVRGYLKSYALLLGVNPKPVLDAHARLTAVPTTPDFKTITPQKEITSRHHQVRFVTYAVALLVIGLALAWWQGRDTRVPNPILTAEQEITPPPAEAPTPEPPFETKPQVESPLNTGEPPGNVASRLEPLPTKPMTTPKATTPTGVPATATPVPVTTPSPPPQSAATGPRAKIVIQAEQDSWADIRDGRQVKLLYETVLAGRTVTLEGIAPVSVFLGNAAGVHLDYNGQPVDIAPYQRGMMARFTLGENVSTTPAGR